MLEGVLELVEELCRFREVLDLVAWVRERPLQAEVSSDARRYGMRACARVVIYGQERWMKRGS
jgi:hypothetical protein